MGDECNRRRKWGSKISSGPASWLLASKRVQECTGQNAAHRKFSCSHSENAGIV